MTPARSPWLFGPGIDLAFGAGALAIPLALAAPLVTGTLGIDAAVLFAALALFCNYPHYFATLHRAYRTADERARYRFYTVYITGAMLVATALTLYVPAMLPLVFTAYLTWSPWHYSGQNYGISQLFLRRQGVQPTRLEARLLKGSFLASCLIALTFLHRAGSGSAEMLSLGIPTAWTGPLAAALLALHLVTAGGALAGMARRHGFRPLMPALAVLTTQGVWFTAFAASILAPGLPFAPRALGLGEVALLHCAQYLWILAWYQRKEAGEPVDRRFWTRYALVLVAGGTLLWLPAPWLFSRLGGIDFQRAFLTFTALINLHHFLLDGALWRLRDPKVSRTLVESRIDAASSSLPAPVARPPAAPVAPPSARRFRVALAGLAGLALAGVAAVDLSYRYAQIHQGDPRWLEKALALNPSSAGLQTTRGLHLHEQGQTDDALPVLERALRLNPRSAAAHHNLGLALASQDRRAAEASFERAVRLDPGLVDAWESLGVLRAGRGAEAEALAALEEASRRRPGLPPPLERLARYRPARPEADPLEVTASIEP